MRNSFNSTPVVYRILVMVICFVLVLIYNRSKAAEKQIEKPTLKVRLVNK